jgi:hypothetical protein
MPCAYVNPVASATGRRSYQGSSNGRDCDIRTDLVQHF